MIITNRLRAKLAELQNAMPNARKRYHEVTGEIGVIQARQEHLRKAPLNPADCQSQLRDAIRSAQKVALESGQMANSLKWIVNAAGEAIDRVNPEPLSTIRLPKMDEAAFALLILLIDPDRVVDVLTPVIQSVANEASPSIAERRAELDTLATRLNELNEEKTDLEAVLKLAGDDLDRHKPAAKAGPKVGDKLPPIKNHQGILVEATWVERQMPGAPEHKTAGWHWHPLGSDPEL